MIDQRGCGCLLSFIPYPLSFICHLTKRRFNSESDP
jgi:hypothetical protein